MLHLTTTPQLVLKAVKQYPYHKTAQPNCFAIVQEMDQLNDENFRKLMLNYENGEFWARDWVANGANPSDLNREFPAVFVRSLEINTQGDVVNSSKDWARFAIGVVDLISCPTCQNRTHEQVKADIFSILKNIRAEILRQTQYHVLIDDSVEAKIWSVQSEIDRLINDNTFIAATPQKDFRTYVKDFSNINYFTLPIDNAIAGQMLFSVNICTDSVQFDYSFTEGKRAAYFKCVMCP